MKAAGVFLLVMGLVQFLLVPLTGNIWFLVSGGMLLLFALWWYILGMKYDD